MAETSKSSGGGAKRKGADKSDLSLTGSINGFTSNLYKALDNDRLSSKNLIFSAFSVHSVLGMAGLGARGISRKEIVQTLGIPLSSADNGAGGDAINNDDFGSRYKSLMDSFKGDDAKKSRSGYGDYSGSREASTFTLTTASKIYVQAGFNLNPRFVGDVKQYFDVEPEMLDFSSPEERQDAAKHINSWVATTTQNKIKDIVTEDNLKTEVKLLLLNAIYFKAAWEDPLVLQKGLQNFNVTTLKKVKVQMMSLTGYYDYRDLPDLDARALAVTYKDYRMSMMLILPNAIDGLRKVQDGIQDVLEINGKSRLTLNTMDDSELVPLKMPKFRIETTLDNLKQIMEGMGMKSIFSLKNADFSGIPENGGKEKLCVSAAIQKAFIDVNENGTEAAAVTAMRKKGSRAVPKRRAPFDVDRPFYYQIVDHENDDLVLFSGHVNDPSQ